FQYRMCGSPICPQSLLRPRRTTMALTNAANVIVLAHISTMIPVMDAWRDPPGFGRSRSSPPPPPGGRWGRVGGGPPRLDWVSVRAMYPVSTTDNLTPAGRQEINGRTLMSGKYLVKST